MWKVNHGFAHCATACGACRRPAAGRRGRPPPRRRSPPGWSVDEEYVRACRSVQTCTQSGRLFSPVGRGGAAVRPGFIGVTGSGRLRRGRLGTCGRPRSGDGRPVRGTGPAPPTVRHGRRCGRRRNPGEPLIGVSGERHPADPRIMTSAPVTLEQHPPWPATSRRGPGTGIARAGPPVRGHRASGEPMSFPAGGRRPQLRAAAPRPRRPAGVPPTRGGWRTTARWRPGWRRRQDSILPPSRRFHPGRSRPAEPIPRPSRRSRSAADSRGDA